MLKDDVIMHDMWQTAQSNFLRFTRTCQAFIPYIYIYTYSYYVLYIQAVSKLSGKHRQTILSFRTQPEDDLTRLNMTSTAIFAALPCEAQMSNCQLQVLWTG